MQTGTLSDSVEKAYLSIRAAIFDGSLTPGAPLRESVLAEMIGVSRTPVRAALSRLEREGLVLYEKYRRYTVSRLDAADIESIFNLRLALEGLAARLAARHVTPDQIAELRALNARMLAHVEARDATTIEGFDRLNASFHRLIATAAGDARLEAMLAGLVDLPLTFLARYRPQIHDHLSRSCQHHDEIATALEAANPDWAESQMRAHLLSVR